MELQVHFPSRGLEVQFHMTGTYVEGQGIYSVLRALAVGQDFGFHPVHNQRGAGVIAMLKMGRFAGFFPRCDR